MAKELLDTFDDFRCWMGMDGGSNHFHVLLKIDLEDRNTLGPFKFNHAWINEDGFSQLVMDS